MGSYQVGAAAKGSDSQILHYSQTSVLEPNCSSASHTLALDIDNG